MERVRVRGDNRLVSKLVSCTVVVGRGRKNGSRKSCVVARRFHHSSFACFMLFCSGHSCFFIFTKVQNLKKAFFVIVIFSFQKIVAHTCDG
jgi:hypothetical protein